MLYLLSPAKTLDYETPVPAAVVPTEPLFTDRAAQLVGVLAKKSAKQVAALMDLSPALAELNVARYKAWHPQATDANSKPAVLAFDGDVYDGLQARTLSPPQLDWAQRHLVILSGLYGVLRPLDRLQPYRLEMGTALKVRRTNDLYQYWGDTIAQHLNERGDYVIVNLASIEYARAALRPALKARVVDCVFEDWKNGEYKIISFFAKKARGLMARWAIEQRIDRPDALDAFNAEGYALAPAVSQPGRRVFRRRLEA